MLLVCVVIKSAQSSVVLLEDFNVNITEDQDFC